MNRWFPVAAASLLALSAVPGRARADESEVNPFNAVVKLEVAMRSPDVITPWQSSSSGGDGSGVVFQPGRILTCAHCVDEATHIRIRKNDEDSIYQGRLEFIDNDSDLAIVAVDDPSFMEDIVPMEIGETPALQDRIVAIGYPMGGDGISFTRGIVSRIEDITYSHSRCRLLGIQVDAAINPGNSGGPVLDSDSFAIVGIAFQGLDEGENLGYLIPPEIIRHFLKDIEDGKVDGCPQCVFTCNTLENKAARRFLRMSSRQSGLLVENVPDSFPADSIRKGDVLMEIDGFPIANNGNIRIAGRERRSSDYPIYLRQIGESIPVKVLRKGKVVETSFVASRRNPRARPFLHGQKPDYYVFGGYVFSTLTADYLRIDDLFHDDVRAERSAPDDEIVVITDVLADAATEGYLGIGGSIVRSVNGVKVRNLRHLIAIVEGCRKKFLQFDLDRNHEFDTHLYLDAELLRKATPGILERYDIPADRSRDLLCPLRPPSPPPESPAVPEGLPRPSSRPISALDMHRTGSILLS